MLDTSALTSAVESFLLNFEPEKAVAYAIALVACLAGWSGLKWFAGCAKHAAVLSAGVLAKVRVGSQPSELLAAALEALASDQANWHNGVLTTANLRVVTADDYRILSAGTGEGYTWPLLTDLTPSEAKRFERAFWARVKELDAAELSIRRSLAADALRARITASAKGSRTA